MAIVPPFENLFSFPYILLSGYSGIVTQLIYSYIVTCIYASAYVRLEASIRRSYPGMNDIVERRRPRTPSGQNQQAPPSGENPPSVQEPQPTHTVQVVHPAHKPVHKKVRARAKKAVKRRKR
jgi:hypothetical protein